MSISFSGPGAYRATVPGLKLYSDTTPMIKTPLFEGIVSNADTMTVKANSLLEFTTAMYLYDALVWKGAGLMKLVLPYIPGARQDRTNVEGDVLFTARSVAQDLNFRTWTDIVVLDPHSPVFGQQVGQRKLTEFPLSRVAAKCWQGYTGIIAADKGGKDRAEQFAKAMGKPIYYGSKTRDVSNGRLTGFSLEPLEKGGHYLVVDDICDGGGTFLGLAEKITEQGCYADLFVTHGLFSKGTDALRKVYKNVYTTDSFGLAGDHLGVYTINVVEEMEKYNGRL